MASVINIPIDVAKSRIQGPQPTTYPNKIQLPLGYYQDGSKRGGVSKTEPSA